MSITNPTGFIKGIAGAAGDFLGIGGGGSASAYDAQANLDESKGMAQNVYGQALSQAERIRANGAPAAQIREQTIAAPDAIRAQQIATPGTLQGAAADELRSRQLEQAQRIANGPSSAAAQMRAAQSGIARQQLGIAARARGADRGSARRDAMLAMGNQGIQAAETTSALAAQEDVARQQAAAGAMGNVRAGDVATGQALTQLGATNMQGDLAAQTETGRQRLTAAQANQQANLGAQTNTAQLGLEAWKATTGAENAALGTALQSVGAQNQAQGVASGYGQSQNQQETNRRSGLIGGIATLGSALATSLSDDRAKTDIDVVGSSVYGSHGQDDTNPYGEYDRQNFLAWQPPAPQQKQESGGLGGLLKDILSDERAKEAVSRLSDERAKEAVSRMSDSDIEDWAEKVDPITFRYRDGFGDDGEDARLGVSAQELEGSGPLGRMMVHRDPYSGLRTVDYGALALMLSKAALSKAERRKGSR